LNTDDQRFAQWGTWVEAILADVRNVLFQRCIFWEVQKIIDANPRIQRSSAFYGWMGSVYVSSALMGVRRQLDLDQQSISLVRLLTEIIRFPQVLSRDRFVALYPSTHPELEEIAHREFDSLVSPGATHIDPSRVREDLTSFQFVAEDHERLATKRLAHLDAIGPPRIPTFAELDGVLDHMGDLVRRYRLLLKARDEDLLPLLPYDWKKIFRVPWIP